MKEIREVLGDGTPVEVAPTPELDELLEMMLAEMPHEMSGVEGRRAISRVVASPRRRCPVSSRLRGSSSPSSRGRWLTTIRS